VTRREIIIVSVAVAAAVYGVYAVVFDNAASRRNGHDTAVHHVTEAQNLITQSGALLADSEKELVNSYVVSLAEQDWIRDPFYRPGDAVEPIEAVSSDEISIEKSSGITEEMGKEMTFRYSGYLEAGKAHVAVINDIDYEVGEEIESTGYVVTQITPKKVTVQERSTKDSIIVPFAGE